MVLRILISITIVIIIIYLLSWWSFQYILQRVKHRPTSQKQNFKNIIEMEENTSGVFDTKNS